MVFRAVEEATNSITSLKESITKRMRRLDGEKQ